MKLRTAGLVVTLALIAMVLVLLMVLSSPSVQARGAAMRPEGSEEAVTIVYWHNHSGSREEFLLQMIDEFNTTNPEGIVVEAEYAGGYGEIYDQVIQGLQGAGPLPNAVAAYPNNLADYARYGRVRFLDDYLEDPLVGIPDLADFYPGVLEYYRLAQYGDQLAGLQHGRSIEVMYYNADLLAAAGQPVPATWDAFETACSLITSGTVSGTVPSSDASRFATWLWSRGGELLTGDARQARFQEQPGIDSLLLFQQLFDDGYGRPPELSYEDQTLFGNGQAGFTFGSSSGLPYYRQGMEYGAQDAWGVTHVPSVPGYEVVDSYGAGVGVIHESEEKDRAAWLFIRWMAEREQTARWAALSGYFPVRISAATHPSMTQKLAEDVQYAQAHDLLPLGRTEPAIRNYESVRRILGDAVGAIFYQGANVTDTLQAAAAEVDLLLGGSGPASEAIPPGGGTLVYTNTEGFSATVEFAPGTVDVTETVSYVPLEDLPTDGLAFALVPNMSFDHPVTITLHYRDDDVVGMDEGSLKLYIYDWAASTWVDADPCGGYVRDLPNNILQAAVCHFSDYALADRPFRVYVPLILKH
jgi:ABC-type glycerol-3-phosphate transport system substrate-binding protein